MSYGTSVKSTRPNQDLGACFHTCSMEMSSPIYEVGLSGDIPGAIARQKNHYGAAFLDGALPGNRDIQLNAARAGVTFLQNQC